MIFMIENRNQWINIYTKEEIKYSNWDRDFFEKSQRFGYLSVDPFSSWWASTDSPITDEFEKISIICMETIHEDSTSGLTSGSTSGPTSGSASGSTSGSNSSSSSGWSPTSDQNSSSDSGTDSNSVTSGSSSTSGWTPGAVLDYTFPFPIDFCTEGLHNCHKDATCVTVDDSSKAFKCNCVNKMAEMGLIVVGNGFGETGCQYTIESKPQNIYGSNFKPSFGSTSGFTSGSTTGSTSGSISGSFNGQTSGSTSDSASGFGSGSSSSSTSGYFGEMTDDFIINFTVDSPFDTVWFQIIT